ncbi:MAG: GxxExxY protein [Flavobacteriales bacterium]|nr:GxxExxY protein [Flavobacteriia bacterium]NCP05577.1 GxxExxY protein [Flavobacteriales bacterium]PIV93521.1 MAG: GxxExxY protein [Flavobacteriaceae bacterium CG17_big_fil_post_rev_8_21_14_2_50_33_15]PIY10576.1 MAG: GxxExxY protein [Flavobacteriaceae bacterium CG_4_10_14_3_um_filter_33_47]PJB17990.1 MAG: GxxExxY protein [Flavobacteriaceae bacterium CG_4_9_14_3_um_filter_33_16]
MKDLIYKEEAYKIIGLCMEVHNQLGKGFNEIVYADALEIELIDNNISYSREKKYAINYKGNVLPHKYQADFIIENKIILEIKAIESLNSAHIKQTLNYLAVSQLKLGLLINFGEESLKYKRIVL